MDQVTKWRIRPDSINLICQAITPPGGKNLPEFNFSENIEKITEDIPWRVAHVQRNGRNYSVYLYRKRAVISWEPDKGYYNRLSQIDDFIRFYLSELATDMHTCLNTSIEVGPEISWNTIPLLLGDLIIDRSVKQPWLSDGTTSFYMRVFDHTKGKVGFIRASRHLVMGIGIGPRLKQEVVNLVYEKFLYHSKIKGEHVFDFLEGLARYTLPTEINLFVQEVTSRLTLFLTVIASLLAVAQIFADNLTLVGKYIFLVISVLVAVITWFISRRIRLVRWE